MEFKGLKVNIIIIVVGIIIISFFAFQHLFKFYSVDKPLSEQLSAINGIKEITLLEDGARVNLVVFFEPLIDFYPIYKEIEDIADKKLGNKQGSIIIENNSDRYLEDIFYRLHYAIYEGISTKEFSAMENKVYNIVNKFEVEDYKLWVDSQAVYLQLSHNNNSLYRRISYINTKVIIEEGGGSNG